MADDVESHTISLLQEMRAEITGRFDDMSERLVWRKNEAGVPHRDDIQTFFDYLDFDEKRR